jgi:glycosyltransferase involved in cell wall biosynthesis
MNLLFFAGGTYFAGMENALLGLMSCLQSRGHHIEAIVNYWNDGVFPTKLDAEGIRFHPLKLGKLTRSKPKWTIAALRDMPSAGREFKRIIKAMSAHAVIHVDIVQALTSMMWVPRNVSNIMYVHTEPGPQFFSLAGRLTTSRMRGTIGVSEFIVARLRKLACKRPVRVVYNGISVPETKIRGQKCSEHVRILIVGRISNQKRHKLLIDALKLLPPENRSKMELVVFGKSDNEPIDYLKDYIDRAGLTSKIHWRGFVSELQLIYEDAHILAAPAVDEGFGLTILEAGLFGLPVVASDSGAFPEIIIDGVTGFLFPPDDAAALAACLSTLISDEAMRAKMGEAGREHVRRKFDISRTADEFVETVSAMTA